MGPYTLWRNLQLTVPVRTGGGVKMCCQGICRSGAMGLCKSNHTGLQYLRTFEEVTVHSRLGTSKACPQFEEHVFNVIVPHKSFTGLPCVIAENGRVCLLAYHGSFHPQCCGLETAHRRVVLKVLVFGLYLGDHFS